MLWSIILGIVTILLLVTIESFFGEEPLETEETEFKGIARLKRYFHKVSESGLLKAVLIGVVVGVINYFAPKTARCPWVAVLMLAVMIGLFVYLMVRWHKDGSNLREMIPFILLSVLFLFTAKSAAVMSTILVSSMFAASILMVLPTLMLVASIGFYIVDALFFYYRNREEEEQEGSSILPFVALVLLAIGLILVLIFGIKWSALGKTPAPEPEPTEKSTEAVVDDGVWYAFYNPSMQNDDDPLNDYNFGYSFYKEELTAADYDNDLRSRMTIDPALGAAVMAWVDANVGTRYLGTFYETCEGNWAETINGAKEKFMNDQEYYYATLRAFFKFLDSSELALDHVKSGLDDQMYMNPFTLSGVPDVIVMETVDHEGHFLVYIFTIKEQEFKVGFRIDCGYQPTNVAKVMGIVPEKNRVKPSSTPEPSSKPEKTPSNLKDKSKGTQGPIVGPNDDPGPGPDTNNGVGATESTKDQPSNSNHMTYEEYDKKMDELEDINAHQKTGGDDNTPTTVEPEAKIDSNADFGTGNGGIDVPTKIDQPVHAAEDGSQISENPAGQWGGPQD